VSEVVEWPEMEEEEHEGDRGKDSEACRPTSVAVSLAAAPARCQTMLGLLPNLLPCQIPAQRPLSRKKWVGSKKIRFLHFLHPGNHVAKSLGLARILHRVPAPRSHPLRNSPSLGLLCQRLGERSRASLDHGMLQDLYEKILRISQHGHSGNSKICETEV
jgi:hypothetical protein